MIPGWHPDRARENGDSPPEILNHLGVPPVQNRCFVPQLTGSRWNDLRAYLLAHPQVFANQGTVVEEWCKRGDRSFGPYFRLKFRITGRQNSIYLGRSPQLADQVRRLLIELQYARNCRRMRKQLWAALRLEKARFQNVLSASGLPPNLFGKFPSRVISFPLRKR